MKISEVRLLFPNNLVTGSNDNENMVLIRDGMEYRKLDYDESYRVKLAMAKLVEKHKDEIGNKPIHFRIIHNGNAFTTFELYVATGRKLT